ncbi:PAS domain-containing protein [Arthrobacter zhaoguopingii]|uniref:PAS domain-containing protein n=1 Tax=Arthrobacter zhaoguopingii TaxID=2681491 RepID=UPI00135C1ED8|nr:PAS domain-containing protein [Arthrobacter zhaoguopingii]
MHLRHGPRFGGGELPEELFIKAMAATSEISLITDASENIQHVSESFTAITGYTADEVLGRNCRMLQGPGTDVDTRAAIRLSSTPVSPSGVKSSTTARTGRRSGTCSASLR